MLMSSFLGGRGIVREGEEKGDREVLYGKREAGSGKVDVLDT